ncbi:MAG TPA: hypothetical protein VGK67_28410 [Myxococcales bacterium]|jgi:hypothetical protein
MDSTDPKGLDQMKVDLANLYREEMFTDLKVATLRRLSPVKADGSPDAARPVLFIGQTHVMTRAGPMPLEFGIEAQSLQEAADRFPAAVQEAMNEMIEEARRAQREQASSLIIPGGAVPPGKIQMP